MASSFLGSEEYDDRAHQLYNEGDYDAALDVLKEGLQLYPHAVELHIGLGYTRLARDEVAWARRCFQEALGLEPEHEDALVGMGEVLLRLGLYDAALTHFDNARDLGAEDDLDLMLTMGRALYRERMYADAREVFSHAVARHPGSAEARASLGFSQYQLGETSLARRELVRAIRRDPHYHEARIFLAHLHYEAGEFREALASFERVPPHEHWDPMGLWRLLELKKAYYGQEADAPELALWTERLEELEVEPDPLDSLLTELEAGAVEPSRGEIFARAAERSTRARHRIRTRDGKVFSGSWLEIVRQLRDQQGRGDETVAQFMRRQADEDRARTGVAIPSHDPEAFLKAVARAGLIHIEC